MHLEVWHTSCPPLKRAHPTSILSAKDLLKILFLSLFVFVCFSGVCSTDLDRVHFPFPLPQVVGHEVVGRLIDDRPDATSPGHHFVCVEINDSHLAHEPSGFPDPLVPQPRPADDLSSSLSASSGVACPFCVQSLDSQCPQRITFGIDRLPGGFAPFFLAPTNSIVRIPAGVSLLAAALAEPFAAALHGVQMTRPREGDRVAVLGPRRLGNLIVAALSGFRKQEGVHFEIVAVSRHDKQLAVARSLGADMLVNNKGVLPADLASSADVVFDTTASEEGFSQALLMAKRGEVARRFFSFSSASVTDTHRSSASSASFFSSSSRAPQVYPR